MSTQHPFSMKKNQLSGAKAAAISAGSIASVIALARAFGFEMWPEEQDLEMAGQIIVSVGFVSYLLGIAKNWWTNRNRPITPVKKLPLIILIPIAALALQGCVTTVPAFGGKTRAETTFRDGINLDGTQYTEYTRNIELPGGVELNGQDDMYYDWSETGGMIQIGQSGSASTVRQADMLESRVQVEAQMFTTFSNLVDLMSQLAAPLIGQHMELQSAEEMQKMANKQALLSEIMPVVLEQMGKSQENTNAQITALREALTQQGGILEQLMQRLNAPVTPNAASGNNVPTVTPATPVDPNAANVVDPR